MTDAITDAHAFFISDVETGRTDARRSLEPETVFVEQFASAHVRGWRDSYAIGTHGRAVVSALRNHPLHVLIGQEAGRYEAVWLLPFASTPATTRGRDVA